MGVDDTIRKFDTILGLRLLKIIHLNDSKGPLGSGRDRHENIGMGYIGEEGFKALFRHEAVRELPFIMETPIDNPGDDATGNQKSQKIISLKQITLPCEGPS